MTEYQKRKQRKINYIINFNNDILKNNINMYQADAKQVFILNYAEKNHIKKELKKLDII